MKSSERGRPSPKTCRRCLKFTLNEIEKHLIVSLPQPFLNWLRELPACHYGEVDQSARVNTMKHGVDSGKHLIYFFFTKHILISRMTMRAVKDPCNKRADLKIDDDFESLMEVDDDKINDTDLLCSTIERNAAFWKWAFLQQVKRAIVLPPHTVKTRGGRSVFRQAYVLPSHAIKTGRGRSTFHRLRQAHVLPPNTVKIRGGRSTRHYH